MLNEKVWSVEKLELDVHYYEKWSFTYDSESTDTKNKSGELEKVQQSKSIFILGVTEK